MTELPFSRPVSVRTLPRKGAHFHLDLDDVIKQYLMSEFGLLDVEHFRAEATVSPWKKNGVKIEGNVAARLIQPCAVTADPLVSDIEEQVDALFVPEGSKLALPKLDERGEIVLDSHGDDLPETFTGDTIDLARIWMEFFILSFNPYLRKEGAEVDDKYNVGPDEDEKILPFAALAALKKP